MERADGNRKLWLLKSTSGHHRPERLAAAIALGILAGLVPKLNLLAVVLYGLILVLPVHTLLAVVVSVCVACLSFQLDTAAHAIGQWLLSQSSLTPLWSSLERAPLVPWMSLHNTVVLGHLVIGTILLAPMYLISLRVFERIIYGGGARTATQTQSIQSYAPVPVEETEPLTTKREPYRQRDASPDRRRGEVSHPQESTVERSPLIIPPPKLHRAAGQSNSDSRLQSPDEPILFEPIDHARSSSSAPKRLIQPNHNQPSQVAQTQPQSGVNAWHMQHATGEAQFATAGALPKSLSQSAEVKFTSTTPAQNSKLPSDVFYPQMTEAAAAGRDEPATRQLPPAPERPEGVLSSLQLAQSASEVLAWVDDLLDECMAEEGMTLITQDTDASTASIFERQTIDDAEMSSPSDRANGPRWLMETTIEIVRLTDETMSDQSLMAEHSTDCQAQLDLSTQRSMENSSVMPTESMTRAWPRVGGMTTSSQTTDHGLPVQDTGEPTILNLNQATGRTSSDGRTASDGRTGFQQLVMAGVSREPEQRSTLPIEPVKGECLAYLLGHLRQSREGKSS